MKIAICFYGQPRRYKQVLDQWYKIITELNADIFIHTWYGEDRGRVNINVNELIEDFNPKEIKVSYPHKLIKLTPEDAQFENQSYHSINQAYSISKCFNLIDSYSKDLKQEYDIIIKTRFDITLHDVNKLIEFVKNSFNSDKIYVAGNHWRDHDLFDDNIMIASPNLIKDIHLNYFDATIQFINETKIIPGGESNICRYITDLGMRDKINKINELDFSLIHLPLNEIIINQNER
jgi:hypothetical protein